MSQKVTTPDGSRVTVVRVCLDIGVVRNKAGQVDVVAANLSREGDRDCPYKRGCNMMAVHNGESWKWDGTLSSEQITELLRAEMYSEDARLVKILNQLV